jgi:hypothetical protein
MAEKRKFAALAHLNQAVEELPAPAPPAPATEVPAAPPEKGRGRASGKRSDPEYKLYAHYLRRKTQRAAVARLQELDDGRDLSDVIEELISKWLVG